MTITALLVPAGLTGEIRQVELPADSLEDMRRLIGCQWIEGVRTPIEGVRMWVDEEGRVTDQPLNGRASGALYPGGIHGNALLTGITEWGAQRSLTESQLGDR